MMPDRTKEGAPAPEAEVPRLTLGAYLAEAGKVVRTGVPKAWVRAVVLEAKPVRQGVRLELAEPTADECCDGRRAGNRNGRLAAMLWTRTKTAIEAKLGVAPDPAFLKGLHVCLLIKATFDPRFHLEAEILDVDPTMIQGLVARRLDAIRTSLIDAGLYDAQHSLPPPADIVSVAVIHPQGAAGWADVEAELSRMERHGIITVTSHPVPFEGIGSAGKIADALRAIASLFQPDIILIVRGGGAAAGFASLADLGLAQAICRCPVPVITGIGHASDRTILDELAWRAADTPSKALGLVKAILRQRCRDATEDHRCIVDGMARFMAERLQPSLATMRRVLADAVDRIMNTQANQLRDAGHAVERHLIAFRGTVDLTQAELDRVADALLAAAPTLPRQAVAGLASLRGDIVRDARSRLQDPARLPAEAWRLAGIVAAFVARQAAELRSALGTLEAAMRRRLGEEGSRLADLGKAAQALDLDATLARGFVLPLDPERRIIRSAEAASAADRFELLFVDGPVACRPTIS